jgi:glycosyltransferase involved in cell wall biosynthesis
MKIAVLSDARLPTAWAYPGHGLGKVALLAAEELAALGHEVTLYAAEGSVFEAGALVTGKHESEFAPVGVDVVLDITHEHGLQKSYQHAPIVNWSQDREHRPGKNAIYPTYAHARFHGARKGRVVRNCVRTPAIPDVTVGDHAIWIGDSFPHKSPILAREAARLAGVKLMMAGKGKGLPGVEHVGPLDNASKWAFYASAKCLIFGGTIEAGPLTVLEAQAMGCPVIVMATGGAREYIVHKRTGLVCADTLAVADALKIVEHLKREECSKFIGAVFSVRDCMDEMEARLKLAVSGEEW